MPLKQFTYLTTIINETAMKDLHNLEVFAGSGGGGGGGCFRAGTRIQQQHGKTIAIEFLKEGDEVLSFDELGRVHAAKVIKVHYHESPEPLLKVKFWNGEIYITPNHWVLNQYASFVEMGKLSTEDALTDGMGHLRPIISSEYFAHEPVWNLTVEPHHTFIAEGVRVHNGGFRERHPVIAGSGGGGGKGGSKGGGTTEAADSLQSREMLAVLDLLGEGQIGGLVNGAKSIYFNNTPVQNLDGSWNFTVQSTAANGSTVLTPVAFVYDFRDGQQVQTPIAGHSDVETPYTLGIKVRRAVAPAIVQITNPNANAVRLIVDVPQLITVDKASGNIGGASVVFKFMISVNSKAYQEFSGNLTISGKTRSVYQAAYQYNLPTVDQNGLPAQTWAIAMYRISDDSTSSALANDIDFNSYVEIVYTQLSYPNSALVGFVVDSELFSSVPQRSYLVNGLYIKVPSNYNPITRIYTGIWDGTFQIAVSNNPAWVLYDLLTSQRYGLGEFITPAQVDKATLYTIGKYCDALVPDGFGGMEPRFTVNTSIQAQAEAYKLISDLCSVFRGMAYWNGGMVSFTQDSPTDPSMVFSAANVIDGLFSYTGASRKDRHSVVQVTWNDPNQYYKQVIEYVEDGGLIAQFGVRKMDVVAFGCTSRGQAHRTGQWLLFTEQYESEMINFSVGLDASLVLPGHVIQILDAGRAGKRLGGRLISSTPTSATLDAPVTLSDGLTATISIRMPDGTFQSATLNEGGTKSPISTVTWAVPLTQTPVSNAIWMISESSLVPMLARVISIAQGKTPTEYVITALKHLTTKYAAIENGLSLEIPNFSIVNPRTVTPPTNLIIAESQYLVAPGLIGLAMDLSWSGNSNSYQVVWSRTGPYQTNPVTVTTSTNSLDLLNVRPGVYTFKVYALNALGIVSQPVTLTYTPVGQMTKPGDVANFQIIEQPYNLLLNWNATTDIGNVTYEVRNGISWDLGKIVSTGISGTSITDYQSQAGTYNYFIRSINAQGAYSTDVATASVILTAPATVIQFNCIQSGSLIQFQWLANTENNIDGYEIREGASWTSSLLTAQTKSTALSIPAGAVGARTFWIKAIVAPGIYSINEVFSTTAVAQPMNTNLLYTLDETALNYPGYSNNLNTVAGTLIMNPIIARGEYSFLANLGSVNTAQNILYNTADAVLPSTLTWSAATFAWNSLSANIEWVTSGTLLASSTKFQIAKFLNALETADYDGWRFNGSLNSFKTIAPTTSVGTISYSPGRYDTQGLMVTDANKIDWTVSIPAQFNTTFWIAPTIISDAIFWHVSNGSATLSVGYEMVDFSFFLRDDIGNIIKVPYAGFSVGSQICIGVVQNATTRSLMIREMGDLTSVIGQLTIAPAGIYTKLCLY